MDSPFSKKRFLTAAEVAAVLRINHQVLVRKLQAGEIPAYKIGKDWRIEERELDGWLRAAANRPRVVGIPEEEAIRRHYFVGGRLKQIPAKRSKRAVVLRILAESFEQDRQYTEEEVNEIIGAFHADHCTLRRELIMARLLAREKGRYWRTTGAGMVGARWQDGEPRCDDTGRDGGGVPASRT